jgi:hypothetical protein
VRVRVRIKEILSNARSRTQQSRPSKYFVPSQLELYPLHPCSFDSPILYSLRPLKLTSPHKVLSCYSIASLEHELVSPAQVASSQLTSPLFLFSLLVRTVIHKRRTIQKTVNLHVSRMRHSRSQYPAPTGSSGDAYWTETLHLSLKWLGPRKSENPKIPSRPFLEEMMKELSRVADVKAVVTIIRCEGTSVQYFLHGTRGRRRQWCEDAARTAENFLQSRT